MKKPHYFEKIRNRIKELADKQPGLRKNRKYKGDSYVPGSAYEHHKNRLELRHLHMVYNSLRGKEVGLPKKAYYSPDLFGRLSMNYNPEVPKMEESEAA